MNGNEICVCGDVADEHGRDPKFPGSTACTVKGCGCVAFELDVEATEKAEKGNRPRTKKLPIRKRIEAALKKGPLPYTDLWDLVFPAEDYPRRGGTPTRGGPPGSYMALSRAIDKYGFKWSVPEGGTLATRIVYPRRKP